MEATLPWDNSRIKIKKEDGFKVLSYEILIKVHDNIHMQMELVLLVILPPKDLKTIYIRDMCKEVRFGSPQFPLP